MSWQDIVLAAGGFVLAGGIIPTIMAPVKPPIMTTSTLVGVLLVSAIAFMTLGLWLTAAGIAIQLSLWGIVLVQSVRARASAQPLAEPVTTVPALGFEEFLPEDGPPAAPAA